MTDEIKMVRERFIEQMGVISQGDGLPRIAGRLMGLMIFDGRPYSFGELAIELQVSRGSISTNARTLEQVGVIERTSNPGDRQDYFQLADDPYVNILKGAMTRSRKACETVNKTVNALPKQGHTEVRARLDAFEQYYQTLLGALNHAVERDN